ncbi:ABC-type sugar transport system, periplasmic component [Thermobacillus xylanilyticus]|uniref:ABC-type sugar transport system, periplasmic component n=1 Tax=Thermobacillus xylanilyticus TaxID=76633 RepID=A0ABN7S6H1_THEXY|nr:extracellular solute-binding protein [Thermobacillus xylanilyticus]CAG5092207.1 ABC-type sugar transport system, periplasmic component [Thermobacillus xylanilyticus]
MTPHGQPRRGGPRRTWPLLALAALLVLASCAEGGMIVSHGARSADQGPDSLVIWLWPGSGYEPFISQYNEEHDDVQVEVVRFDSQDLHANLQTAFAAGYGAPDVVMIDLSYMERFKRFPSYFYNLRELASEPLDGRYLAWNWQQAASPDGSFIYALPASIGPMTMLFRVSLYGQAGLPLDRGELAESLPDWDSFLKSGISLRNRTGKPMIDNIGTLYRAILGQAEVQYFDPETGAFIGDTNPAVREAWGYAVAAKVNGLSAGLQTGSTEWAVGMEQGHFATLLAPAWMLSYVTENSPGAVRQWNMTRLPGGAANWGGWFFAVPRESRHPDKAWELIRWLTDEQRQLELFREQNIFPSLTTLYDYTDIRNKRDGFFMGAPVGQLLSEAALAVRPVYAGAQQPLVEEIMESALQKVENGLLSGDRAWEDAMRQIRTELAAR